MRTIKFRAYIIDEDIIVYPWDTVNPRNYYIRNDWKLSRIVKLSDKKWQNFLSIETKCELMQFTWLLDKNGKEIYEGDIVWINTFEFWEIRKLVIYDAPSFFLSASVDEKINVMRFSTPNIHETVIWNIYENPELLTK